MKIYLDLVLLINFFFDFLLLFGTSKILKKQISLKRLLLGSLTGAISLFLLFINLNTILLFIVKILLSILIIIITFGIKDLKNTITYFYILSIILGGTLYLLDITFSYKNTGLIFIKNKYFLNIFVIILSSPIIIYRYIKEYKKTKRILETKYNIEIIINKKKYLFEALLDTGNDLKDPYKNRPVILIDKKIEANKIIYVPYKALNTTGVIPCLKPDKVLIDNKEFTNCLIGLSKDKFSLNGTSCILPNIFKEELI